MSDELFNIIALSTILILGAGLFSAVVIFIASLMAFRN